MRIDVPLAQPVGACPPRRLDLPPGPRGALWQTIRYVRNPLQYYLDSTAKYGDTFTVPSVLGPVVVVSHPTDLRTFFSLPPHAFQRWSVDAVRPLLGAGSILVSSGASHLTQRRMIAPALHRERVGAIGGQIMAIAGAHADAWPIGETFVLQDRLVDLSIEAILRAVLGLERGPRLADLHRAIRAMLTAMSPTMMLTRMVAPSLGSRGPYARFWRAREDLDRLIYETIDMAGAGGGMVDMLCGARDDSGNGFSRDELRDQLVTLIFAGHETSAIALTWALYWLDRNPEVLARLLRELDDVPGFNADALARLPYLDAVCKETLRLYPTVPEVIRQLNEPLDLRKVHLPADTAVAACIVATHHLEDLYPAACEFKPERFLAKRFASHEYLPFGGGVHRCAGEALAWLEMKVILSTIVDRLRVKPSGGGVATPVLKSITMGPRGGIPVTVRPRTR
jgi:cytochrome P450 family 110